MSKSLSHTDREAQDRFIEDVGLLTEADGMPRIAGRVFALLLLAPEPLAMDQIADQLSVSRASVSTDTRQLELCVFLERVTRKGDRKVYYQVRPNHLRHMLERRMESLRRIIEVLGRGQQLPGLAPDVRARLDESHQTNRDLLELMSSYIHRCQEKSQ